MKNIMIFVSLFANQPSINLTNSHLPYLSTPVATEVFVIGTSFSGRVAGMSSCASMIRWLRLTGG